VIYSLTANIGQFGSNVTALFIFFRGENVFRLGSEEYYLRSQNLALPQDSHSLRGSTRNLWTVLLRFYKAIEIFIETGNM
jgi:hypothetical protein